MITICVCTYKRPILLHNCLDSLAMQTYSRLIEVVVVDNDGHESARDCVVEIGNCFTRRGIRLMYAVEPVQSIALARNRAVMAAQGGAIAFIDDDEVAAPDWLEKLAETLEATGADAVFGTVVRVFSADFPVWLRRSWAFRADSGPNRISALGAVGNCLVTVKALSLRAGPFRPEFGLTGSEDTELFDWLKTRGCRMVFCGEAIVREYVEEGRQRLLWHLSKAYTGGWGYAKIRVDHRGMALGLFLSLRSCLLGSGKAILTAPLTLTAPRTCLFTLLLRLVGQVGKVGYFLGLRREHYARTAK